MESAVEAPKAMMIERDAWNSCRFVPRDSGGHYESYFQRANHPQRPLAFWIRYTVFSPMGRPDEAVGELWAIYFDGESNRITAVKEVFPIESCELSRSGLKVRIGAASLHDGHLTGRANSSAGTLEWNLQYAGNDPPLLLLPRTFYERGFPKAKALVGTPNAEFEGQLIVNGATINVERWIGSQNHNWGSKHTDSYAWGQVAGFDDAPDIFLECSTARLKMGPFWIPPLTATVLRIGSREIRLNSLVQAFRAQGEFDFSSWRFTSSDSNVRISAHIHAPKSAFVGLAYANPPGGTKTCLNTKLASCELILEQTGQPQRTLISRNRAAFEVLTERRDHGIPIVA